MKGSSAGGFVEVPKLSKNPVKDANADTAVKLTMMTRNTQITLRILEDFPDELPEDCLR